MKQNARVEYIGTWVLKSPRIMTKLGVKKRTKSTVGFNVSVK